MSKNILLIQFSARKQGNCKGIAEYIRNYYGNYVVQIYTVDINTMPESLVLQIAELKHFQCLCPLCYSQQ